MENSAEYKYFTTDKWNNLTIEQRKQLLMFVENRQAIKQNRCPIPIQFQKIDGFGSYSRNSQIYVLNEDLLKNNIKSTDYLTGKTEYEFNSFEALDTIIHEGYHREQHLLAMGNQRVMPHLTGYRREKYREKVCENFLNYSTPNYNLKGRGLTSFPEYYLQPLEISVVMNTTSDLIFNDALYPDKEYQFFLNEKIDEEKKVRIEALRVYGPNYERILSELREIRGVRPYQASQIEHRYRDIERKYELDNRQSLRRR